MRTKILSLTAAVLAVVPFNAPSLAQQQDDNVGRAAMQPLRDTRIKEDKIPEILQLAASAPYSSIGMKNCAAIAAEVRRLDEALGVDVDAPAEKKGEGSAIAAAAARAAVNTLIPGLGLVRVITGADKAQRRAEAAVYAGSVRRGFLKGMGVLKKCRPPAAPLAAALTDRQELPPVEKDNEDKDKN